jgi:hypothetical protein
VLLKPELTELTALETPLKPPLIAETDELVLLKLVETLLKPLETEDTELVVVLKPLDTDETELVVLLKPVET